MNLDSCIPDVWLAVATDSVRFCGYRFFWLFTGYKAKEGGHIHDRLVVLPTASFCEYLLARGKNGT